MQISIYLSEVLLEIQYEIVRSNPTSCEWKLVGFIGDRWNTAMSYGMEIIIEYHVIINKKRKHKGLQLRIYNVSLNFFVHHR